MRHIPCEMDAALHILNYDEELKRKTLPFVDIEKQAIDWYGIFRQHFGSGHHAAVLWAYCLWADKAPTVNPFEAAFSMEAGLRRTVIQAIAIRWCLPMDSVRGLRLV